MTNSVTYDNPKGLEEVQTLMRLGASVNDLVRMRAAMNSGSPVNPFPDIYESTVLTELIRRDFSEITSRPGGGINTDWSADKILPLKTMNGRHVKIRIQEILPTGLAQFRAPHATPALWTPKPQLREQVIEIVDIDEMSRIDPVKMLALKSPDPNLIQGTYFDIIELGTKLQERNELRTEWMRWQALQGALVVTYPNAGSITINYGIPAGHFPIFGTPWSDVVNSDPIEDLWALGAVSLPDAGIYLSQFHLNSVTFRYMRRNQKIRQALSTYGRDVMLPTDADLAALLRAETQLTIVDSGYLPEGATNKLLTKFLPDGQIMATTRDYTYAGRGLGDMADGWVLVSVPGQEEPDARQGMQSEILGNKMAKQTFLRQASARMPRLYAPEAITWGKAF